MAYAFVAALTVSVSISISFSIAITFALSVALCRYWGLVVDFTMALVMLTYREFAAVARIRRLVSVLNVPTVLRMFLELQVR